MTSVSSSLHVFDLRSGNTEQVGRGRTAILQAEIDSAGNDHPSASALLAEAGTCRTGCVWRCAHIRRPKQADASPGLRRCRRCWRWVMLAQRRLDTACGFRTPASVSLLGPLSSDCMMMSGREWCKAARRGWPPDIGIGRLHGPKIPSVGIQFRSPSKSRSLMSGESSEM